MKKHADILRPKFEAVEEIFSQELGGLGIADWTSPKGGYFISFNTMEGCAKEVVSKCAKAGVTLTSAGATWPGGKDPKDSNIRVAPSFPPLEDLKTATRVLALCTKLVTTEKLLKEAKEG
jgi:DNA-binding transcriptional MocR family regulator